MAGSGNGVATPPEHTRNMPQQQRTVLLITIWIEQERYAEARELLQTLPAGSQIHAYLSASLAISEGDQAEFERSFDYKSLILKTFLRENRPRRFFLYNRAFFRR